MDYPPKMKKERSDCFTFICDLLRFLPFDRHPVRQKPWRRRKRWRRWETLTRVLAEPLHRNFLQERQARFTGMYRGRNLIGRTARTGWRAEPQSGGFERRGPKHAAAAATVVRCFSAHSILPVRLHPLKQTPAKARRFGLVVARLFRGADS